MNRQRIFNNNSTGGITGSKRILTPLNNENGTTLLVDSKLHSIRRSTRGMTSLHQDGPKLEINQLAIQMKNHNSEAEPNNYGDPISQISEITESMYLCGYRALKVPRIRALGITMIINVTVELQNLQMDKVEYIKISIEDSPVENLSIYFDKIADKIDEVVRKGGKVLVHCMAGISRSASLCIAYLMKYKRMSLRRAYQLVKSIRPIVHPNPGFFRQLIEYEMKLFGITTMSIVYNSSTRNHTPDHMFESNCDSISTSFKTNKYRIYNNISRPLELPLKNGLKYGRQ